MKELILLRGLPGAGKSTFAKLIHHNYVEADHFFLDGLEYKFDASKLHLAHQWCQESVEKAMINEVRQVVVSNTFTTEKEIKPYIELAIKYDYRVTTAIVENRHGNKSVHNVPEEAVNNMKQRFSIKL